MRVTILAGNMLLRARKRFRRCTRVGAVATIAAPKPSGARRTTTTSAPHRIRDAIPLAC